MWSFKLSCCFVWVSSLVCHLREECGLRVFENRVLRRIFGPKRDEVTGDWKRLHNEKLNDLLHFAKYYVGHQMKKNEMGGACGTCGRHERFMHGFGGKP
jgi:hypothetical protein